MASEDLSRRGFLKQSTLAAAPAVVGAGVLPGAMDAKANEAQPARWLKVVCVGAHPDDPESGCAGTLARYAAAGHAVTVIYLTRGERGIPNTPLDDAAAIRSAEAQAACEVIGAKAVFAGQIDGATEMTRGRLEQFQKLLSAEAPDVVFAHWPIDTHFDHQVASLLAIRACLSLAPPPHVYFFEVNTGSQTQGFSPTTYIDISPVLEKKKLALFAHRSQKGEGIWREHHEAISRFRGREAGVDAAEAFVHLSRDSQMTALPGV